VPQDSSMNYGGPTQARRVPARNRLALPCLDSGAQQGTRDREALHLVAQGTVSGCDGVT
jgi:hypothetical protein